MEIALVVVMVVAGYLVGSLSFTRIVIKLKERGKPVEDLEVPVPGSELKYKVSAYGATAASMRYGTKTGILVSVLDILKIFIPVLILRIFYPSLSYMFIFAAAGMVGHIWPVYFNFRGGRGISTYYGGLLAIDPIGALVTMSAGMILGFGIIRDYFIAYMSGLWFLILWVIFADGRLDYLIYAIAVNIIYVIAMLPDFRQYINIKKQVDVDPKMVMDTNPMGRGMIKMSEWFSHLFKGRK